MVWPGQDEMFKKIKAAEDMLRLFYSRPRGSLERPDHNNPVYGLLEATDESVTKLRRRAIETFESRSRSVTNKQILFKRVGGWSQYSRIQLESALDKHISDTLENNPIISSLRDFSGKEHICLAGGAPLDLVLYNDLRYAKDYDLFIVSSDEPVKVADDLIEHLTGELAFSRGVRGKHALTLTLKDKHNYYHVQIIFRSYASPSEVLTGFDLDASGVCYWMDKFYLTLRASYTLNNMMQYVDIDRLSPSYEFRLAKYAKRGFVVYVPIRIKYGDFYHTVLHYTSKKMRRMRRLSGLGRLLVLESIMNRHRYESHKMLNISDYEEECEMRKSGYEQDIRYLYHPKGEKITAYMTFNQNYLLDISEVAEFREELDFPLKAKFMTENPGQQGLTGSFQPLTTTWEEWSNSD